MVAAAFLWEEAELGHAENLQVFGLILPRLTFFLDTLSRHGFNKDPTKLNEEELAMVQRIGEAAVYLGQRQGDGVNKMPQHRRTGRQGRGRSNGHKQCDLSA